MTDTPATGPIQDLPIWVAGRKIDDAADRVRRYCGLPWSGGPPETWAYRYYDQIPTGAPDLVEPLDVMACAALHPQVSRNDLAWFHDNRDWLNRWLQQLAHSAPLYDADDNTLRYLGRLAEHADDVSLTLLTKVLHRKRPLLIPLLDRHIIDAYRSLTSERSPVRAWAPLLQAIHDDLSDPEQRLMVVMQAATLSKELGQSLPELRMIDITVWMGAHW